MADPRQGSAWALAPSLEIALVPLRSENVSLELAAEGRLNLQRPVFEVTGFREVYSVPPLGLLKPQMAAGTLERTPFADGEPDRPARTAARIEQVYAEHVRYVWRCLRALGVHGAQLADAVHAVFLVVKQKLGEFDDGVPVTTWLYAIALRIAPRARANARRDAWRFASVESATELAEPVPGATVWAHSAEHELERDERLSLARRALDRLDDDKREAFVLSQVEQRSAPEIADIIGIPVNTVYSRIRAAKLAFQAEIARLRLINRGRSR
jgi:RNA polymerase sigma-70 factor (ECF subfamily)